MKAINESGLWKKRLGDWVVNPYIGCEHGCLHCYCPAMPGVKFFNGQRSQEEWGSYVLQKEGIVDALRAQLRTFTPDKAKLTEWGNGWVLMSFLTDCYQPIEGKLQVTRTCLELLLEAGHKVRIQTRSCMVERDFDLLAKHGERVLLGTSLPYLDEDLARVLEPRATGPLRRLEMLRRARDRGIPIYVAVAPVMPWTTEIELSWVLSEAVTLKPREIFIEVLNPKGSNLEMMAKELDAHCWINPAVAIKRYDAQRWAKMTFQVLSFAADFSKRVIPWPDTQRGWKKHLQPEAAAWLAQFLPPAEVHETHERHES